MTRLENALQLTLVSAAEGRLVRLTRAGEQIARSARGVRKGIETVVAEAEKIRGGPKRAIVACFSVHVERILADALISKPKTLSDVRVEFDEGRDRDQKSAMTALFTKLKNRDVDLAVGGPKQPGFTGKCLYSDRIVAMLRDDDPLWNECPPEPSNGARPKRYLSVKKLAGRPLLLPPEGFFSRAKIEKVFKRAGVRLEVDTELASPYALYALGTAKRGVPLFATDAHLPNPPRGRSFPVLVDADENEVDIEVFVHSLPRLKERAPGAWAFKEYLLKHAERTGLREPRWPETKRRPGRPGRAGRR